MGYITNITVLLICFLYFFYRRDLFSPLSIFISIWAVIITLYNLSFIKLNPIGDDSWLILFVGIMSFVVGYLIVENLPQKQKSVDVFVDEYVNYKYLIALAVFAIVLLLPLFISQMKDFFTTFDLNQNKISLVLGDVDGTGIIYQYVARPLQLILPMLGAVLIFKKNKKAKYFVMLSILILIIEFISGGVKQSIIFFVAYIFLIGGFLGKFNRNKKYKYDKKIIMIALALVAAILYFISTYTNLIDSLYLYIAGCIPMFESAITADYFLYNGYTYGFSAFQGIFRVIFKLLNTIGFYPSEILLSLGDKYRVLLENGRDIGGGNMYNSMGTVFYSFYYDGGIWAVIIGMLLFGAVAAKIYRDVKKQNSTYHLLLYVFLMYFILNAEARFQFYSVVQAMGFIFILLLIKPFINRKTRIVIT